MVELPDNKRIDFDTDHLLSKWGFQDGELLEKFLQENGYAHLDGDSDEWYHFSRRVLCEAVECFVCPQITNAIKPYRVLTNHNPIRVYEVNGRHITDWEEPPTLQPLTILVPKQIILATAASLYTQRFNSDGEVVSYMVRSDTATAVAQEHNWE